MFDPWNQSRRATAAKVLAALIGATGCLAAVAYAASAPSAPDAGHPPRAAGTGARPAPAARLGGPRPPRPRITRYPATTTLSTRVVFRFVDRQAGAAFQCRLDSGGWKRCGARVAYRGLAVGMHRFLVRAEGSGGGRSLPARFQWLQAEPKSFSIAAEPSGLAPLYPGAAPVAVPLVLTNPNSSPIFVTGLRIAVTGDAPGCRGAENLELIPATASTARPLQVPPGGSVRLPAQGVSPPAIALRNLPVNQDACQGASFPLAFSGEARG